MNGCSILKLILSNDLEFDSGPLGFNVDALIDSLLDPCSDESRLWTYLVFQIGYLYQYTPALKTQSSAKQLKYEHRQFHIDSLSGISTCTVPFALRRRAIREALRLGNYRLWGCSATRDNEDLFQ